MHGLKQFASIYNSNFKKYIPLKELKWGEEMEYLVYAIDKENQCLKLTNQGPALIKEFNEAGEGQESNVFLMPEFGAWMIEAVPSKPYDS